MLEELNMDEDDLDASATAAISEVRSEQLFFKEMITDGSDSSNIAYDTINTIAKSTVEVGWTGMDAVEVESLQSSHCQGEPPSYQVIGDNIDFYVKTKHMANNRQNKGIHWFLMNAVQDRITGEGLENCHQMKPIMEVENAEFLPSKEDNNDLLYDFVLLRTRDLAENVPACVCFRDVVVSQMISHTNSAKK